MKVNYIGIACLAVLLLTACDESKYELENLVPEEYHKVLYINNPVRRSSLFTIRESLILMLSPFIRGVVIRH